MSAFWGKAGLVLHTSQVSRRSPAADIIRRKTNRLLRSGPPKREGRSSGAALSLCRNYLDFGDVSSLSTLAPGTEVLSVSVEDGLAPTVFRSCFRA